jgi:hypothetical protein
MRWAHVTPSSYSDEIQQSWLITVLCDTPHVVWPRLPLCPLLSTPVAVALHSPGQQQQSSAGAPLHGALLHVLWDDAHTASLPTHLKQPPSSWPWGYSTSACRLSSQHITWPSLSPRKQWYDSGWTAFKGTKNRSLLDASQPDFVQTSQQPMR